MTAKRIAHNSDLCTQFIAAHKVSARYPRVTDQVETLSIEKGKLVRFGYNPSILAHDTGLLMAYRYHDGDTLATKLALAELDLTGNVLSNRMLEVPANGETVSVEDPKLFRFNDEVWIEWVQSTWPNFPLASVVKYGRLDGNKIVSVQQPAVKVPKPVEKNWVPMSFALGLRFIYECEPEQIIFEVVDGVICDELRSPGPAWAYGPVRGGTPPLLHEGKLLRFFHSGLDNEFGPNRRRYFLGALLMDPQPPFTCVAASKRPIVYGSELDNLSGDERRKCHQYKRQVVFPGGAIAHDGAFLVSVGINDSACAILKIKPDQLNL
jgi:predicted GH43/DUF377 family glycosyl hydrolase